MKELKLHKYKLKKKTEMIKVYSIIPSKYETLL